MGTPMLPRTIDYIQTLVDVDDHGCWVWRKPGPIKLGRSNARVVAFEEEFGTVYEDLVPVTSCGNGRCVNPEHMMLVQPEKIAAWIVSLGNRANQKKTYGETCPAGHREFKINKKGQRICKVCSKQRLEGWRKSRPKKEKPVPPYERTHCVNGHAYSEVGERGDGIRRRVCLECERISVQKYKQRRAAKKAAQQ